MKLNFKKMNGLIPAIIQDSTTMQVLMLGFMNEKAYEKTIKTGLATFWSRSKGRLWQKGEGSGNCLEVISVKKDCDSDTLLILAKPRGSTCHKGKYSCFGERERNIYFLEELFNLIKDRKEKRPKKSYTASLFDKGLNEILKKVGEESIETIIAAKSESRKRLIEESGDLLYHLLVLLAEKEISLNEVVLELIQRYKNNSFSR